MTRSNNVSDDKTAELRALRKNVSKLKQKGLLSKQTNVRSLKLDSQSAKYLKTQVKKFADVLSGAAKAVKVNNKNKQYYKNKGYVTKNNRVVVPVRENESVVSTRGDFRVVTKSAGGKIVRIDMKLPTGEIEKWRDELIKRKIKLKKNEQITFQLYGNNSYRSFLNFEQLIEYLEYYGAWERAQSGDPDEQSEFIENVVIFRVEGGATPPRGATPPEEKERIRANNRARKERWIEGMDNNEWNKYLDKRAQYERERRIKMKMDPEKYNAWLIKQRAATQKYRFDKNNKK